ncbi:MAG: sulfatase [Candidatus Aminicenantales bacterium]
MSETFFHRSKSRLPIPLFTILCAFLLIISSNGCRKKPSPRNFILITLDTQRADFVSYDSPENARTPHLDLLAQQGTVFKNCYSLIPITLPSHASIFYSVPPHIIKNYTNGQVIRNKRSLPSFVNVFKKNGFTTAAFVSLGVLKSQFGLEKGFDLYVDKFPEGRWYLYAEEVNRKVFPWLEKNHNNRFFLWIHYSDPHDPYAPPDTPDDCQLFFNGKRVADFCLNKYLINEVELILEKGRNKIMLEVNNPFDENPDHYQARLDKLEFNPSPGEDNLQIEFGRGWFIRREERDIYFFKKQGFIEILNPGAPRPVKISFRGKLVIPIEAARDAYKREVEYMDSEIGRLWKKLEEFRLFENTAILVVGDHGEGLGDFWTDVGDPHIGHIHYLYGVYMKVPFILYNPFSSQRGSIREEPVTLLDVAPTTMNLMDFKKLSSFQGRDLLRLRKGKRLEIFEETYKPEAFMDKFGLLSSPWHIILTPEEKKFEIFNLHTDPKERTDVFQDTQKSPEVESLKRRLEEFVRQVLKEKEEVKIDRKTEEMLRALGYVK